MNKRLISLIIVCMLLCSYAPFAIGHPSAQEHYDELELVLFGGKYNGNNKEALMMLEYASTLAIDQFNGFHANILSYLSQRKIAGLPPDVKATKEDHKNGINYTASAKTHREATHRGWDWNYGSFDRGNWSTRKNILLSATSQVFGFKQAQGKYDKQCNSFCAFVYYVHLIGDHQEDTQYKENGPIVSLAEKNYGASNIDIFFELERHLPILFEQQKSSRVYGMMMRALQNLARNARDLTGSTGGINTPEKLAQYHAIANELIQVLRRSVPALLMREEFFKNVFYTY